MNTYVRKNCVNKNCQRKNRTNEFIKRERKADQKQFISKYNRAYK